MFSKVQHSGLKLYVKAQVLYSDEWGGIWSSTCWQALVSRCSLWLVCKVLQQR